MTGAHCTATAGPAPLGSLTTDETKLVSRALRVIESKRLRKLPLFQCKEDLLNYLVLRFAGLANEQGHVIYLDIDSRLLEVETAFHGNQKSVTTWSTRHVVQRAFALGADKIVYAHNHPNDNDAPSSDDIKHFEWSERVLKDLDITLLDSYVVTSNWVTSIKEYRQRQEEEALQRRMNETPQSRIARRAKAVALIRAQAEELSAGFFKLVDKLEDKVAA